jgi:hypothetical protein
MWLISYLSIGVLFVLAEVVLDRVFLTKEQRLKQAMETKKWFEETVCPYFGIKPSSSLDYVLLFVVMTVLALCLWPVVPILWVLKYGGW